MKKTKERIENHLVNLDPGILHLARPIESIKIRKAGLGKSNLDILAAANGRKFVARVKVDPILQPKQSLSKLKHISE